MVRFSRRPAQEYGPLRCQIRGPLQVSSCTWTGRATGRAGLEAALRDAVRSGRLEPGHAGCPPPARWPATWGWPVTPWPTPTLSYVAEGWLTARQGSTPGWRTGGAAAAPASPAGRPPGIRATTCSPGSPDLAAFPRTAWPPPRRALDAAPAAAFGSRPAGPPGAAPAPWPATWPGRAGCGPARHRVVVCAGFAHGPGPAEPRAGRPGRGRPWPWRPYGLPAHRDTVADGPGAEPSSRSGGRARRRERPASEPRAGAGC